jgi:5-methylcytosine-specific restriction enzyme subunit McrC
VKGRGFSIRATSYVGIVQLPDGWQIEILPKLSLGESEEDARKILIKMLAAVYQLPISADRIANVAQEHVTLLEYFIPPFLDEIENLIRKGLRAQYERIEDNEPFLRGKLMIVQNARLNIINRTRFFCEYDIFSHNRPENRLLHSLLEMLYRFSRWEANKKRCYRALQEFLHIPKSENPAMDLRAWDFSHENRHYQSLFSWCRILIGLNPTLKTGGQKSYSLLFPMENLFESYVSLIVQSKCRPKDDFSVLMQSKHKFGNWLNSEKVDDAFGLKPDLIIQSGGFNQLILDAKWKKAEMKVDGYNISEADLYQIFIYVQYFKPKTGLSFLIYPKTSQFDKCVGMSLKNSADMTFIVYAMPFDLREDTFCLDGFLDISNLDADKRSSLFFLC